MIDWICFLFCDHFFSLYSLKGYETFKFSAESAHISMLWIVNCICYTYSNAVMHSRSAARTTWKWTNVQLIICSESWCVCICWTVIWLIRLLLPSMGVSPFDIFFYQNSSLINDDPLCVSIQSNTIYSNGVIFFFEFYSWYFLWQFTQNCIIFECDYSKCILFR